eukprot:TRINITY_DN24580_c0_g1_i1.p1 TRINITY_DN24580_c0_g1~~TRINITY_DN24580_c0_g1_i1.p1  ORF type:complete len:139 (-),score=17.48 TRINITY_DN24580_c0_g1_i1:111-527(-)
MKRAEPEDAYDHVDTLTAPIPMPDKCRDVATSMTPKGDLRSSDAHARESSEAVSATDQIDVCEGQISEARSLFEACGSFEHDIAKTLLRTADDILTRTSQVLDSLKLEGDQRDMRRILLGEIEVLGATIGERLSALSA